MSYKTAKLSFVAFGGPPGAIGELDERFGHGLHDFAGGLGAMTDHQLAR
jgi:hypothetical protein